MEGRKVGRWKRWREGGIRGRLDGRREGRIDGRRAGEMDGWRNRRMERVIGGWRDGRVSG